jgi:hypothetical protein
MSIANAPLTGYAFNQDNQRVFGMIKQLTLNGVAFSYIDNEINRKNGHEAWLTLRQHYEGEAQVNRQKDEQVKHCIILFTRAREPLLLLNLSVLLLLRLLILLSIMESL